MIDYPRDSISSLFYESFNQVPISTKQLAIRVGYKAEGTLIIKASCGTQLNSERYLERPSGNYLYGVSAYRLKLDLLTEVMRQVVAAT